MTLTWFEAAARRFETPKAAPYVDDPVGWAQARGIFAWSKQRDVLRSIITHKRTAVRSAHDTGKSFTAGLASAFWVDQHPIGEAFVASTAPTYPQVHAILWEEIRKQHRTLKLAGRVLQSDEWKTDDGTLIGYGRKPADTDEHGFQGIHRRFVLVVIDEACGVPEQLWTAVEAITTNADCRILAIGNPDDPNTEFGKVCKPGSGWNVIEISAFDTPNFTDEPVPDSLRHLLLAPEWVEDKKRRWGETSPRYVSKVLGRFPEIGHDTLIEPRWIEAAQQRSLAPGSTTALAVDVARFGADRTCLGLARGPLFRIIGDHGKTATTETTGLAVVAAREHAVTEIRVDGVGVGGGVVDQLLEQGWPVLDMQSGAGALDSEHYKNARAEWWWGLRERFEAGDIDLDPADDELAAQLGSIKYKFTSRGQIQIESKDDMKKRGLPSPDRADTAMLAYARVVVPSADLFEDELFDDPSAVISMY